MISAKLGMRIKALRIEAHLTLEDLSGRSSVSRAMLSKVERGEKSPTLPVIVRIAGGLGLPLSALLGAEPDLADVAVIRASERLAFRDLDGAAVDVETPLPEDLAVPLRQLETFDERRRRPCD